MSRKNAVMLMMVGVLLASIALPLAFAERGVIQSPITLDVTSLVGSNGKGIEVESSGFYEIGPGGELLGSNGGILPFEGNFQEIIKKMLEEEKKKIKEDLAASDSEWKVIEPRLTKVMTLSRSSSHIEINMMDMGHEIDNHGKGGREAQKKQVDSQASQTDIQKATKALSAVLEKKDAPAADINAKLLALRKAREKSKQELVRAQKALKDVLTVRQEAILVLRSILN